MRNRRGGFTLIELVVVIVIIGIITAISVPAFSSVVEGARKTADVRQMEHINLLLFTGEIDKYELANYQLQTNGWSLAYSADENCVVIIDSNDSVVAAENEAYVGTSSDSFIKVEELSAVGEATNWWNAVESISQLPNESSDEYKILAAQSELNLADITEIPESYFKNNDSLIKVYIGSKVTSLPNNVFSGCTKLTEVEFAGDVVSVGAKAFRNCSSLKKLSLPNVTKVDSAAFINCNFDRLEISTAVAGAGVEFKVNDLILSDGEADAKFGTWLDEIKKNISNSVTFNGVKFIEGFSVKDLPMQLKIYMNKATLANSDEDVKKYGFSDVIFVN